MNIIVIFLAHRMRYVRRRKSSDKSSPAPSARRAPDRTHFLTGTFLSRHSNTANERLMVVLPLAMRMSDMQYETDWLTRFMDLVTVTGKVDARCALGAPWTKNFAQAGAQEIPYHIILTGRALLESSKDRPTYELRAGDIVLLPHGLAHVLHDGSGAAPVLAKERVWGSFLLSENG